MMCFNRYLKKLECCSNQGMSRSKLCKVNLGLEARMQVYVVLDLQSVDPNDGGVNRFEVGVTRGRRRVGHMAEMLV